MTCAGVLRRRRGVCSQTRRAPVGATMTDFRRISRHRPWAAAGCRGWRGSAPVSRAAPGHWWPAPRVWRWPGPAVSAPRTHHPPRGLVATPAAGRPTHAPPPPPPSVVSVLIAGTGGWAGLGWAGGWHHTATWSQFPGSSAPGCQSCALSPPSSRVCSRATPHKFANSCRPRTSPALPDLRN